MKKINEKELERISNEARCWGLPTQVRYRMIRPTHNPTGKVYHEDKRFSHWDWVSSPKTPLELRTGIENKFMPLVEGEKVEFFIQAIKGMQFIVTSQFKAYDTELRQYRWSLER